MSSISNKKRIDTGRGKICYFFDNSFPGRPTVILLHGLSSNHTTWNDTRQTLQAQKINCLVPDLRGHGWSDKRKQRSLYHLPIFADDLHQIIEKESIKDPTIVGYSFGGPIALHYALRHPTNVRQLILISSGYLSPLAGWHLGWFAPIGYSLLQIAGFLVWWQHRREYIYFDANEPSNYWKSTWVGLNTMPLTVNAWMLSEMVGLDLRPILPRINTPTAIVRGEHDPFVNPQEASRMAQLMPNAKVVVLKDLGHFIAHSVSELTAAIVQHLPL